MHTVKILAKVEARGNEELSFGSRANRAVNLTKPRHHEASPKRSSVSLFRLRGLCVMKYSNTLGSARTEAARDILSKRFGKIFSLRAYTHACTRR